MAAGVSEPQTVPAWNTFYEAAITTATDYAVYLRRGEETFKTCLDTSSMTLRLLEAL